MTQEDKELLLKDLCARLPYGVKGYYKYYDIIVGKEQLIHEDDGDITSIDINLGNPIKIDGYYTEVEYVKPYLRPMSSMTEEEKKEFLKLADGDDDDFEDIINYPNVFGLTVSIETFDWLNSHHFDYRGLIEKGLGLEALEGMYKNEIDYGQETN